MIQIYIALGGVDAKFSYYDNINILNRRLKTVLFTHAFDEP